MQQPIADRIQDVPPSFLREILTIAQQPDMLSFAGGLPNRALFPLAELKQATDAAFEKYGTDLLQYSDSDGHLGLRQFIAQRYQQKQGLSVNPNNILITSGAQQGLDLVAKVLLNEGDSVAIEAPGYLGAIQLFSLYKVSFQPLPLTTGGVDLSVLDPLLDTHAQTCKLFYGVPNFQNPSGACYSEDNRQQLAERFRHTGTYVIEDDPYSDLRFTGEVKSSFAKLLPQQTLLLGSFSKTVVPALRLGWIVAPDHLIGKLRIAKQATDLHSNYFGQCILHEYLSDNDLDHHVEKITTLYQRQCQTMMAAMADCFPAEVSFTRPDGGMFCWVTLPSALSSRGLLQRAMANQVLFVPGDVFYTEPGPSSSLRLNFSCVDQPSIERGIGMLAREIRQMI